MSVQLRRLTGQARDGSRRISEPAGAGPDVPAAEPDSADAAARRFGAFARPRNLALLIVVGFALVKLLFSFTQPLHGDEAYGVVLGRSLDLSYLDHPPLHQWIAHFSTLAFGENELARLPFIALFAGASWLTYLVAESLFGAEAALIAIFCLNASWDMLTGAGIEILPANPLIVTFALAMWAFARLMFGELSRRSAWLHWLIFGLALGLAGLSKYHAVFLAFGAALFVVTSPDQRRWLKDPAVYASAVLALAVCSPVLFWNAGHDWASFRFQSERLELTHADTPLAFTLPLLGTPFDILAPLSILWALASKLTPWIFAPLVAASVHAFVWRRSDPKVYFLLCLGGPLVAWFILSPAFGVAAGKGWSLPGVFFFYPILGDWLSRYAARWRVNLNWAAGATAAALFAALAILASNNQTGWIGAVFPAIEKSASRFTPGRAFARLGENPVFADNGAFHASFVVTEMDYSSTAKLAIALGPRVPTLSRIDSHGPYFQFDQAGWIGKDAVIVATDQDPAALRALYAPWFDSLETPVEVSVSKTNASRMRFVVLRAHGLKKPFPFASL